MLPRLDQQDFYAMYRAADLALDGHAWSGCNTTYEALACGLPVITWPGAMMRGRHSMAILRLAGLNRLIADSADRFVALAIELGRDAEARRALKAEVAAQAEQVFDGRAPIDDLAALLQESARS